MAYFLLTREKQKQNRAIYIRKHFERIKLSLDMFEQAMKIRVKPFCLCLLEHVDKHLSRKPFVEILVSLKVKKIDLQ